MCVKPTIEQAIDYEKYEYMLDQSNWTMLDTQSCFYVTPKSSNSVFVLSTILTLGGNSSSGNAYF